MLNLVPSERQWIPLETTTVRHPFAKRWILNRVQDDEAWEMTRLGKGWILKRVQEPGLGDDQA